MLYDHTLLNLDETRGALEDFLFTVSNVVFLNEELVFKIKLIVKELVTNSFKYARPCSYVRVMAKLNRTSLSIAVMDDGAGFDFLAARACCPAKTDPLRESGRGIYLVDVFSDRIRCNRKGNIIAIKVNLV